MTAATTGSKNVDESEIEFMDEGIQQYDFVYNNMNSRKER